MAIFNTKYSKIENNTGFGEKSQGGRYFKKDGLPNVIKIGLSKYESWSWFHALICMPPIKFLTVIIIGFLLLNTIFTFIYMVVGIDRLQGISSTNLFEQFSEVFFFSAQTFTTVGYGRISPIGFWSGLISTIEAFTGLMSFALASSLFYARFAKPQIHLRFAKNAIIAPYKNKSKALMIRLAPTKGSVLTDVEAKLTLAIRNVDNNTNKFYQLPLEISTISAIPVSWTLVHEINDKSPLFGFNKDDFEKSDFEVLVFVKAFEDAYANQVVTRHSFLNTEIVYGVKYRVMYYPSKDKSTTILDFGLIDAYETAEMP
jgi:inward rectifier potassium channel